MKRARPRNIEFRELLEKGYAKASVLFESGDYPWKLNRVPVNDVLVEGERDKLNEGRGQASWQEQPVDRQCDLQMGGPSYVGGDVAHS